MYMKILFALAVLGIVTAPAMAQQFELVSGSAQIGHVPGRIDVLKPLVKPLSLGENVSFRLTVRWPQDGYNPCSEPGGCQVTVGIRHRPDGFTETWSTFHFLTNVQTMSLDLPSKSDDNVLPRGYHDVFVRIMGDGHTLGVWHVPVAIDVDYVPKR